MKIGFDAKRAYNNKSGLGNYSRFLIDALIKKYPDKDYVLFTPKVDPKFIDYREPLRFTPSGLKSVFSSLWRMFWIKGDIISQQLDVFHGLSNELPVGIDKVNVRKVVTIHDLIFMRYPSFYKKADLNIYKKKFAYACSTADTVIAVSKQTKEDIQHFFGTSEEKIEVIGQDCDKQFLLKPNESAMKSVRLKYNLPENYIIAVGSIEERKNQLRVVEAFVSLGLDDVELVLIGKRTEYQTKIESYLNGHGGKAQVRFLNDADFNDFPAVYSGAKMAVYCSLFEGFGIPVVEAFTTGVPLLTSEGGCFEEVAGEAALKVDPRDVEAIANGMKTLLNDNEASESFVAKGFEHVKQFRAEVIAEKVMRVYER